MEEKIYDVVEESAEFPGGRESLISYLTTEINVPEKFKGSGKVYVKFVVTKSGNIKNIVVLKTLVDCPECDDEVVRAVSKMPNWIPAKIDGEDVNCYYTLPINVQSDMKENGKKSRRKNK